MKSRIGLMLLVATLVLLSACSKSSTGTGGDGAAGGTSGNWDSLVWDQGNWS